MYYIKKKKIWGIKIILNLLNFRGFLGRIRMKEVLRPFEINVKQLVKSLFSEGTNAPEKNQYAVTTYTMLGSAQNTL